MASPSVTYTFANLSTADATQVNQNFTDLINGMTDGTRDFAIAALTAGTTATFNGDFLISGGSIASSLPVKTNANFDLGSATLAMRSVYLGTSTFTTRIIGSASASWTLTLPPTGGTAHYLLRTDGSGTSTWIAPVKGLSSSCSNFSGTSTAANPGVAVTNLTVTATFTGRDVEISLLPDGSSSIAIIGTNTAGVTLSIYILKDNVVIAVLGMTNDAAGGGNHLPGGVRFIDPSPSAGSHTYKINYGVAGGTAFFNYLKLSVREIF